MTLPGILEIAPPNSGDPCFGLSTNQTRQYLDDWTTTYFDATTRWPIVRVDLSWYDNCTDYPWRWPHTSHMALIGYDDDAPPQDHDLQINYGTDWVLWGDGSYAKQGEMTIMSDSDADYLITFASQPE